MSSGISAACFAWLLKRAWILSSLRHLRPGREGLLRLRVIAGALVAGLSMAPQALASEWQAREREEPYLIEGTTGPELYASIGERGPAVGGQVRAIAHTTFKLTWTRDYQPRNGGCVLARAKPKLTITYTLPKPAVRLSGAVRHDWQAFIAGVRKHEKAHGAMILGMVREIERISIGLTVGRDPGCRKIREELTRRLVAISQEQRRKSRDFDGIELGDGGNIHRLILRLVNGG
jgi:predicted secreted Zn-dependent protease